MSILRSIAVIVSLFLTACSPATDGKDTKKVTLHLFTWSDYTEETAVKQFEERFGIKVASDTFELQIGRAHVELQSR